MTLNTSNPQTLARLRDRFHALSDGLRLEVLTILRDEEQCVCDLCDRLAVAQSKLSFHLKILKEAGLIQSRAQGRWVYYRLDGEAIAQLETAIAQFHPTTAPKPARHCDP
ncbi:metalloregulator ArsR/SmtB family transcription factor [Spirulina major CS-329]|uniref:ArsR/SmtB family transcription factor n=1 Tax=Spirulina TaxID=1154 RepID=UPI00232D7A79|nr:MULTISPECIES: metalloregulator ArsR/SmtB family transcription factor [Spirulina]MDB9493764.1 metalloregulator ArsR/SmtB family transcription factor [Spirulina subsalsa CS-330]MDB9503260.1 metalloregulator ArsR/SmtB family transcription factor [Spirulina major CS-329]